MPAARLLTREGRESVLLTHVLKSYNEKAIVTEGEHFKGNFKNS